MEGVRILAENAVYETVYSFGFHPMLIFVAIFLVAGIWMLITSIYYTELYLLFMSMLVCSTILVCGWAIASEGKSEEVFSHIEYKVIIEDGVELNEFLNHYEILDQDGEIYTVKEKGEN